MRKGNPELSEATANVSIPDNAVTTLGVERRRPRKGRRALVAGGAAAVLFSPAALATMGNSGDGGGASGGSGSIGGIELTWGGVRQSAPSSYDDPVAEAGRICSGISPQTIVGVAAVEDGPVFNWNPNQSSPANAVGPMQFEQSTWNWGVSIGLFEAGSPTDVSTAIHNGGEYLCYLYKNHGGDLNSTLEAYNGGAPGYADEVDQVANSVTFQSSNSGGGGSNKEGLHNSGHGSTLPRGVEDATYQTGSEVDFPNGVVFDNVSSPGKSNEWKIGNKIITLRSGKGSFKDFRGRTVIVNFDRKPATMDVRG